MNKNTTTNPIHAWHKSTLASEYVPNIEPKSALKTFNRWIAASPGLMDQLLAAGYIKTAKILTPAQVAILFDRFGPP